MLSQGREALLRGKGTLFMNILFQNVQVVCGGFQTACVVVSGDRISYIGENAPAGQKFDRVINGRGKALLPGLYNAHTHSPMTLLRSYADGHNLQDWLENYIFPVEDRMCDDDAYAGACLAVMEMLATGTVCFNDMYMFMGAVAKACAESGMKANLARCVVNFSDENLEDDSRFLEAVRLFEEYNGFDGGRILVDFAPHSVYCCTPKGLSFAAELAQRFGTRIHVHLSETVKENDDCQAQFGATPAKLLEQAGIFEVPATLAHCVHLSEADMDILEKNGASVCYNPTSNLKLGSGIASVDRFLARGINVALGTDGASSNNNLNMFEETHLASLITNGVRQNPTAIGAADAFYMATRGGALAMGRADCGEMKEGFKADLVLVDLNRPHLKPMHSLMSNAVYAMQGSDVTMTMVDGKILYENGEFKTIDAEKVYALAEKSKKHLFS